MPDAGALHLKSLATALDASTVLVAAGGPADACFPGVRIVRTDPGEDAAANVLALPDGRGLLMAAGFRRTQERLERAGFQPAALDISEFEKGDAGLTSLSLVLEVPAAYRVT